MANNMAMESILTKKELLEMEFGRMDREFNGSKLKLFNDVDGWRENKNKITFGSDKTISVLNLFIACI